MQFLRICLLPLAFVLAACGKDEPKPSGQAAAPAATPGQAPAAFRETVAALAPADAQIIVQCASASRLAAITELGGMAAPRDPLALVCARAGVDAAQVDRTKPFAFAVTFAAQGPPEMTFLLPCTDPAAVVAAHKGSATKDGYVALSAAPAPAAGGSRLPADLPAGDVSARVDLAALLALYGPQVDQALKGARAFMAQMGKASSGPVDVSALFDLYFTAVEKVVASAESLDFALTRRDDGVVDLDLVYTAKAGSALDLKTADRPSLRALAAELPPDFPCTVFLRFDWSSYMGWMGGFFDSLVAAMPADRREAFHDYLKRSEAALAVLGREGAFAFDCGAEGVRTVMVYRSPDPGAYVREYLAQMRNPVLGQMGMAIEDLGTHEVAGAQAHRLRFRMDAETYMASVGMNVPAGTQKIIDSFLGPEGLIVDMLAKNDLVVMTMDRAGTLAEHAAGGKASADRFAPTLSRASGSLDFALDLELRRLMQEMMGIVKTIGTVPALDVPAGPPLPVSLAVASDGRVHHVGASANVPAIRDFFASAFHGR
jgi:hypothetical protein